MSETKTWHVPYRLTTIGTAEVEAPTAEAALAIVDSGDFECAPGEERVDWRATGKAWEVK